MNFTQLKSILLYIFIAILCIISNIVAFIFQFCYNELPCPLCLLQRFGFIAIGFGATLSALNKPSWKYDLIILLSSTFTLIVGLRQVILHIAPNDPGYGSTLLGLHFYTWSAIMSFALILLIAATTIINTILSEINIVESISDSFLVILKISFIIIIFINIVSTFFECGVGLCPPNPVSYMKL